jgi:hypothetical protein
MSRHIRRCGQHEIPCLHAHVCAGHLDLDVQRLRHVRGIGHTNEALPGSAAHRVQGEPSAKFTCAVGPVSVAAGTSSWWKRIDRYGSGPWTRSKYSSIAMLLKQKAYPSSIARRKGTPGVTRIRGWSRIRDTRSVYPSRGRPWCRSDVK